MMDKKARKARKQLVRAIALRFAREAFVRGLGPDRYNEMDMAEVSKYTILLFAEQRQRFLDMAEEYLRGILSKA